MSVKERFIRIREHHHYNKTQFAEFLGTNPQGISDIETGRKKINIEIAQILHEKLQVNLNWLISGTGNMKIHLFTNDIKYRLIAATEKISVDSAKVIKVANLKNMNRLLVEICSCGKRKDWM